MKTILCDESHEPQILAILNHAILTSTALYDYHERTPEMMATWFANKRKGNYPVIGIMDDLDGSLLGFGTYGPFRSFPGYKYTVEHSIYVRQDCQGRGLGKLLLQEVIQHAQAQDYHVLVGVIDSQNAASIALHQKFGFVHAGRIQQAGFKFKRWLDVDFYQLTLSTPAHPVDG